MASRFRVLWVVLVASTAGSIPQDDHSDLTCAADTPQAPGGGREPFASQDGRAFSHTDLSQSAASPPAVERDSNPKCIGWAAQGECERNPNFMLTSCTVACRNATTASAESPADTWTDPSECVTWAGTGECEKNKPFMESNCALSCQTDRQRIIASREADAEDTWKDPSKCVTWAGNGECEKNKPFMERNCALSCVRIVASREAYARRCSRPAGMRPALEPGGMKASFDRIMTDFGHLEPEMVWPDPPVVLFHAFLSDAECAAFVRHGQGRYSESKGTEIDPKTGRPIDVRTEIRTSSQAWCNEARCLDDPLVDAVQARVSDVTQTPASYGEYAQLVYYRACPEDGHPSCAFYRRHTDYIEGDQYRVQGPRIYTLFMYLNDVPEGGGTRFMDLGGDNITFTPQKGKAILWPSVLNDDPLAFDPRTHHEALPVTKGEKYGANFWIHQYAFKGPYTAGCLR